MWNFGYYKKEDLRNPVRRVLRWPIPGYKTPKYWPSNKLCGSIDGNGVIIPSKASVQKEYKDLKNIETTKSNLTVEEKKNLNIINTAGPGFEPR